MSDPSMTEPELDPTPIFELFRGAYATELLTAAAAHFQLFDLLAQRSFSFAELRNQLGLEERPAHVLLTALRAMNVLTLDATGQIALSAQGREFLTGGEFDIRSYLGLAAESPGVRQMAADLRANLPRGTRSKEEGAAFIFRQGLESAMDQESPARRLTLALAGRARICAPALARVADLASSKLLVDVGGGTGLYAIACLRRFPKLRAVIFDGPQVLKVAEEYAREFQVADRLSCVAGDMFADPMPAGADAILLSNVLHDWDVPQCRRLLQRCAAALRPGGQVLIHDVFLDDDLGGPLPVALYSAALFTLTEGRAYSAAEYRLWLSDVGLVPADRIPPTNVHCGLLTGRMP